MSKRDPKCPVCEHVLRVRCSKCLELVRVRLDPKDSLTKLGGHDFVVNKGSHLEYKSCSGSGELVDLSTL